MRIFGKTPISASDMRVYFKKISLLFFLCLFFACKPAKIFSLLNISPPADKPGIAKNDALSSYILLDAENLKIEDSNRANVPLVPASCLKVITIAVAMKELGEDFRFVTELSYTGVIENNVLEGNLILSGHADPELNVTALLLFIEKMKSAGVKRVHGRYILNENKIPSLPAIELKLDKAAPYNPAVGAFMIDHNIRYLRPLAPGQTKHSIENFYPPIDGAQVKTAANTSVKSDRITYHDEKPEYWQIERGTRKQMKDRPYEIPVKNPSLYAAKFFQYLAAQRGIELPEPSYENTPSGKIIYEHRSRPLYEIVGDILDYSSNIMAESLLLALNHHWGKVPHTLAEAAQHLEAYVKSKLPAQNWDGMHLVNGSGLSRDNFLTAAQLAAILYWAEEQDWKKKYFHLLLPLSGWKGTLRNRLSTPDVAFLVHAKTGTLYYAISLAGYFFDKQGRKKIFVIFYHDPVKRAMIDAKAGDLLDTDKELAENWLLEKKKYLDNMVQSWRGR
jgi:D-alanyl-D-alanine carboxypeptidase/D-alanyl-D-alanine-endopeptidase (penicillin-binding protein 4)